MQIAVKRYKSEHPYCSNWEVNSEMTKAYVVGNGPSRKSVNLEDLKKEGVVYGCNALYRDWEPDYLLANDWRMMLEIIAAGYKGRCVFCDFNPLPAETFDAVAALGEDYKDLEHKLVEYGGDRTKSKEYILRGSSWQGGQEPHNSLVEVVWLDESLQHIEWGLTPIGESLSLIHI